MANVSEIVRGAVQLDPDRAVGIGGLARLQPPPDALADHLPQCVKRMLPPWMNLYAILTMATVLASVVGVSK
jgi:polar amino acid transport system permease protein